MRTPQTLKTLLLAALSAAALGSPVSASSVYVNNRHGPSGAINAYCDGVLITSNVLPQMFMMFPIEVSPGPHVFVVTPSNMALGQGDLARASVNVEPNVTYTLRYFSEKGTDPASAVLKLQRG
ncbi:hypothetical protein, partial [Deinococcus apachensis]